MNNLYPEPPKVNQLSEAPFNASVVICRGRRWHTINNSTVKSNFSFRSSGRQIDYSVKDRTFGSIVPQFDESGKLISVSNNTQMPGRRGRKKKESNIVFPPGQFTINEVCKLNNLPEKEKYKVTNEINRLKKEGEKISIIGYVEKKEKKRGKPETILIFGEVPKNVKSEPIKPEKVVVTEKVNKVKTIKDYKNWTNKQKLKKVIKSVKVSAPTRTKRPVKSVKKVKVIKAVKKAARKPVKIVKPKQSKKPVNKKPVKKAVKAVKSKVKKKGKK